MDTLETTNGTETENRLPKGKGKKPAPKSKFMEGFEFLRDSDGTNPATKGVRKTEEGNLSLTIKAFPDTPDLDGVQAIAEEVGLKANVKSGIGEADYTFSKSLAAEEASAFVEIVNE